MKTSTTRKRLLVQATIVAVLAFSGCMCQYDPYAHLYTTTKPTVAEVAGTYELTEQTITRSDLKILNGQTCQIVLKADGTYQATNYPNWLADGVLGRLTTTNGTWTIEITGGVAEYDNGPEKRVWGVKLDGLDQLNCRGDSPPDGLIFSIGDPDEGHVMIFERQP